VKFLLNRTVQGSEQHVDAVLIGNLKSFKSLMGNYSKQGLLATDFQI